LEYNNIKMKIIHFVNENKKNPFNPQYSYFMAEDTIHLTERDLFIKYLLDKEKEILKKYPPDLDGHTNLGSDSLTSRFIHYNLLDFTETAFLKEYIRDAHDRFLKVLKLEPEKNYYVQCWFNVMRKGEQIQKHQHARSNSYYLSGHICVNVEKTNTYYESPYYKEPFASLNELGKVTLFPSWLTHWTDKVENDFERITIAFDIKTEEAYNTQIVPELKNHWVKI
tara:strand:- start:628 stop:1299 length:672 start_codon:yes stop_codon:yes gene_type:complete